MRRKQLDLLLGTLSFHWKIWQRGKIVGGSNHKTSVIMLGKIDIEFDKASPYECTRERVDRVNRGGLTEVTDDFFLFIRLTELECEKF